MRQRVEHRIFLGVKYYRYPDSTRKSESRYFKRGPIYLHRVIWAHHNGLIPVGCQIHHRDEDTTNNRLDNLELVTPKQHAKEHWTEERAAASREHLDKVRHRAAVWHRSKVGREWHRALAKATLRKVERLEYECERCGKRYKSLKRRTNRYCSSKCRAYARRDRGDDNEARTCPICGKEHIRNRYSPTQTCSRKCGAALRRNAK